MMMGMEKGNGERGNEMKRNKMVWKRVSKRRKERER